MHVSVHDPLFEVFHLLGREPGWWVANPAEKDHHLLVEGLKVNFCLVRSFCPARASDPRDIALPGKLKDQDAKDGLVRPSYSDTTAITHWIDRSTRLCRSTKIFEHIGKARAPPLTRQKERPPHTRERSPRSCFPCEGCGGNISDWFASLKNI